MLERADLIANLLQLGIAATLTGIMLLALWGVVRAGTPGWALAVVLITPLVLVYLNAGYREAGYHGFMHTSLVYATAAGGLSPEDPLLAGQLLYYPFLHHWLLAQAMTVIPMTPGVGFAATNLAAMVATTFLLLGIVCQISDSKRFAVLATVLALAGGPLLGGPVLAVLRGIGIPFEVRHIPYIKFAVFGSNQLGLTFYILVLWATLRWLDRRSFLMLLVVVAGVAAAALFYAFSWLTLVASVGAVSLAFLARSQPDRRIVFLLVGAVAVGSALGLPYLLSISLQRSEHSGLALFPGLTTMVRMLIISALAVAPPLALLWVERGSVAEWARAHRDAVRTLVVWSVVPVCLAVVLGAPMGMQYKFLAHALIPLGILAAYALGGLGRTYPLLATAILFLWLLPAAWQMTTVVRTGWPVLDPTYADGPYLRHGDRDEDALYSWIAGNTEPAAVFVDGRPTIAALGRRSLYVAFDARRARLLREYPNSVAILDGWNHDLAAILRDAMGHPETLIRHRQERVAALLDPTAAPPTDSLLVDVVGDLDGRPVFVVARDPTLAARFRRSENLEVVYRGANASIFRVSVGSHD